MPADYTLMAVPLGPGHHLLRLEYAPSGWIIGRRISLASLLTYMIAVIVCWLLGARVRDRRIACEPAGGAVHGARPAGTSTPRNRNS